MIKSFGQSAVPGISDHDFIYMSYNRYKVTLKKYNEYKIHNFKHSTNKLENIKNI